MMYKTLLHAKHTDRPHFYSNFVATVDGKVVVTSDPAGYWPLGSKLDHDILIELRTHADALIHGATTASSHSALESLNKPDFFSARKRLKKNELLPYFVLSGRPNTALQSVFAGHKDVPIFIITTESAVVPPELDATARVIRFGQTKVDLPKFAKFLHQQGYKNVLVEGGPHVLGSFLADNLLDEIFLTITPKIFGNDNHQTLTMVEGHLFSPKEVKNLHLISVIQKNDELFLRYQIK